MSRCVGAGAGVFCFVFCECELGMRIEPSCSLEIKFVTLKGWRERESLKRLKVAFAVMG